METIRVRTHWLLAFASAALLSAVDARANDPRLDPTRPEYFRYDLGPAPVEEDDAEFLAEDGTCNIIIGARPDFPRLALNTRGPISTVRALAFSPDSSRIYSAGFDKIVQVWGVRAEERSIRRAQANQAILVQTLRWEVARGLRGSINVIAASPVDRQLAIGGYGARDSTGDVIIYDTARGQVTTALRGHNQPIVSLDYSPDGKRLVSVGRDGSVRLWTNANGAWDTRVIQAPRDTLQTSAQPAKFLDNSVLAVSLPADAAGKTWQIALYNVDNLAQPIATLPTPHQERISSIAVARAGQRWASADWAGNIYVWTGFENPRVNLLRRGRTALDLEFGPADAADLLFVATQIFTYANGVSQSALELWDAATGAEVDSVQTAENESNFAVAVSPDGTRVVTYGGDDQELRVYLLKDRQGNFLVKPLSTGSALRMGGVGRSVWKVAFADDNSYRLGFGTDVANKQRFGDHGKVQEAFDLTEISPLDLTKPPVSEVRWRGPNAGSGAWTLARVDAQRLNLLRDGAVWNTIQLDPDKQGRARTYCWIAGNDGQPYAVAVGTDIQQGIFVYGLGRQGEQPRLLRYYRDHNDAVTSLSASADGKYLASGSLDQTIKIWSLEGLRNDTDRFAQAIGWGATFEKQQGRVVVTSVLEAGTASRKGLRVGDVIIEATFPRMEVVDGRAKPTTLLTRDANELFNALEQAPLTGSVLLGIERKGNPLNRKVLIVPAWDPMMTLFVDETGEWAIWAPQGYYESSVNGNELFGWQLNRGIDARPDFFRADQFSFELERPEVLKTLLAAGSLSEALRRTDQPVPKDENRVVENVADDTPVVTILSPLDGEVFDEKQVKVVARVNYPNEELAQRVQGVAYVNGVPGKQVDDRLNGKQRTYEWNLPIDSIFNRARVVAESVDPQRMVDFSDVHFRLRGLDLPQKRNPKLFLVTIAASDYKYVQPLQFPVDDAKAITEILRQKSGKLYDVGGVVNLRDAEITREAIDATFEKLRGDLKDARSDDLVIVFMAGHGLALDNQYYFVTTNANVNTLKEQGISWKQFQKLAELPCRKLVMLDTCHSGNVLPIEKEGSKHWKAAIRPLKQEEILVMSATDAGQAAIEFEALGHGIFTQCLLDGFSGAADSAKDGEVDLTEIVKYVQTEVPKRTEKFQLQTPRSSPVELFQVISVPLVTVN